MRTVFQSIVLCMLLMGMGSPTCTQSDIPLGGPEDGFVDYYLIGEWQRPKVGGEQADWWATIEPSGETEMVFDLDGPQQIRMTWNNKEFVGYSTWLKGNKYLNLRMVECLDCSNEKQELLKGDVCPYQILRYWTYVPELLLAYESDSKIAAIKKANKAALGRLLLVALMDPSFVKEQIAAGQVAGIEECDTCFWRGVCLRAAEDKLRRFVVEHESDIYLSDAGLYIRANQAFR